MPKKPKRKTKRGKAKAKKRGRKPKRMPDVKSMRRAIEALLDKTGFSHSPVRDNRHTLVVTDTSNNLQPFTINMINGKIEDIDMSKGGDNAQDTTADADSSNVVGDQPRVG